MYLTTKTCLTLCVSGSIASEYEKVWTIECQTDITHIKCISYLSLSWIELHTTFSIFVVFSLHIQSAVCHDECLRCKHAKTRNETREAKWKRHRAVICEREPIWTWCRMYLCVHKQRLFLEVLWKKKFFIQLPLCYAFLLFFMTLARWMITLNKRSQNNHSVDSFGIFFSLFLFWWPAFERKKNTESKCPSLFKSVFLEWKSVCDNWFFECSDFFEWNLIIFSNWHLFSAKMVANWV